MTIWESVGKSHYGALAGVEQYLQVYAARRLNAFIDFAAGLPGCRRMTVNEGKRSRPTQIKYRTAYELYISGRGPFAPLAAALFFSRHDEVKHGNAADMGGPNGETINSFEQAAIREHGPAFGIDYTGPSFGELWHIELSTAYYPAPGKSDAEKAEQAAALAAALNKAKAARLTLIKKELNNMSQLLFSKRSKAWYEVFEFSYDRIEDHDEARRLVVARNGIPSVHLAGSTVRRILDRSIARRKAFLAAMGKTTDALLEKMVAELATEPTGPDASDADIDDVDA